MKWRDLARVWLLFTIKISTPVAEHLWDVCAQAKQNNPTLEQSLEAIEQAKAAYRVVRAQWLPQLGVSAGYQYAAELPVLTTKTDSYSNSSELRASCNQKLFDLPALKRLALAKSNVTQAVLQYRSAEEQLFLEVCLAYFEVNRSSASLKQILAEERALRSELRAAKTRVKVGLSPVVDVQDAQAQYDLVQAKLVIAQNRLANAKEDLYRITGKRYTQLQALPAAGVRPWSNPIAQPGPVAAQSQIRALEIQIAQGQVAQAEKQLKVARAGHWPTLALTASAGQVFYKPHFLDMSKSRQYTAGVAFTLPLFAGGATCAASDQAYAAFRQATSALLGTQRTYRQKLQLAQNNYHAAELTLQANQQVLRSVTSAYQATLSGYEAGTRTFLERLNAVAQRYQAEQQAIESSYDYLAARLTLAQVMGVLDRATIEEIGHRLSHAMSITPAK